MAIGKSLYQAPEGIAAAQEEPIEIEIVDPEAVHIRAGDLQIDIEDEDEDEFSANLAEEMDESELMVLGSELVALFEADQSARKDWADTYVEGLKLLGLKYEETTEPWANAFQLPTTSTFLPTTDS